MRISGEGFNKAVLHMGMALVLLNATDWNKNPSGIIPVSTAENIPPTLVACYFF